MGTGVFWFLFLADRTNGRAYASVLRLSHGIRRRQTLLSIILEWLISRFTQNMFVDFALLAIDSSKIAETTLRGH